MNNKKSILSLIALVIALTFTHPSFAVEITGKVVGVEASRAKIAYESDFAPREGDKVKIGYVDEDGDYVRIRESWEIVDVGRDYAWAEDKSGNPGTPEKDHMAKIQSDDPQKRSDLASLSKKKEEESIGDAKKNYQKGLDYKAKQDYVKAAHWFKKAAELGYAKAQTDLGRLFKYGKGVPQDYSEAVQWYRRSAKKGESYGQNNLGTMYQFGRGVPQNYAEAVKWYRRSAEQGNPTGQSNLGTMYFRGKGVPQNYVEAVKWYRKSAEQGYPSGQSNLGVMYRGGLGVKKDYAEALTFFQKAADQGNLNGFWYLAEIYDSGWGVHRDERKAEWYLRKAAMGGHTQAQDMLRSRGLNGERDVTTPVVHRPLVPPKEKEHPVDDLDIPDDLGEL